jgi:hypothetical protein
VLSRFSPGDSARWFRVGLLFIFPSSPWYAELWLQGDDEEVAVSSFARKANPRRVAAGVDAVWDLPLCSLSSRRTYGVKVWTSCHGDATVSLWASHPLSWSLDEPCPQDQAAIYVSSLILFVELWKYWRNLKYDEMEQLKDWKCSC